MRLWHRAVRTRKGRRERDVRLEVGAAVPDGVAAWLGFGELLPELACLVDSAETLELRYGWG